MIFPHIYISLIKFPSTVYMYFTVIHGPWNEIKYNARSKKPLLLKDGLEQQENGLREKLAALKQQRARDEAALTTL